MLGPSAVAVGILASLFAAASALRCLGSDSDITTYPGPRHNTNTSDIAVRYNDSLEILCVVDPSYSAGRVRFVQKVGNAPKRSLQQFTHVVNETTARLFIERPERQSSRIECELQANRPQTCFNTVVVDTVPEDVLDFYCRSYNLERFVCRWHAPVLYARTEYTLVYNIYGYPVNACKPMHKDNYYNCTLKGPSYRTQEDPYNFKLTATNRFGTNTQHITVNHFANLIPGPPSNLVKKNLTAHSVVLTWNIPLDVLHFAKGVATKIQYKINTVDNVNTSWHEANVSQFNNKENYNQSDKTFTYLLKGLPYAHWRYDVRIRIRSKLAEDKDEFWSDFLGTTFMTKSERPPHPPKTEHGAFRTVKLGMKRDVDFYFQQVDEFYESGENFTYHVFVAYGNNEQTIYSNKSSYVRFRASLVGINVSIASSNNEGLSVNKSYIYIPPEAQLLDKPTSFTKTVYGNKTYDLRWQPPHGSHIDGYTLFWCPYTDVEQHCSGKLNFSTLGPNATSHRVMVSEDDKTYMFAISANRGALSSGMVWGECTLPAFNATNKVAEFKRGKFQDSNTVELDWNLGCSFSEGHVLGYNITYCRPRANPSDCNGNERFMLIQDSQQKKVNVTGLTPYSTYSFHISVVYKDGLGYSSDSVDATTLEGKPSEPLHPTIANVTAHTMRVSWDPPASKNGHIGEYKIIYFMNGDETNAKEANKTTELEDTRQELTLTQLQAFTNYTVKIQACTTRACSDGVVAAHLRTAISAPSQMYPPSINKSDLVWTAPSEPGGTVDMYQVQIRDSNKQVIKDVINTTASLERDIPRCDFSDEQSVLYYRVRAVNFDGEKDHGVNVFRGNVSYSVEPESWAGETHYGPWSEDATLHCGKSDSDPLFWVLGVFFVVVFFAAFALGSRKMWIKYKTMTDIGPVLPPGLGPVDEKDAMYQLGGSWTAPGKKEEKSFAACDEALLLPQRATDNKNFTSSSDSTDSTTLSLTSKDPQERDAVTSDDASDSSSIRERPVSPSEPPPPTNAAGGYISFVSQPVYGDDYGRSGDSTSSDDSTSVRVQTGPPPNLRPGIPTGYVIAQDAGFESRLPKIPTSFPPPTPMQKTVLEVAPLPKLLPAEWKLTDAPETGPFSAKPGSGYVSHTDTVIGKHLDIMSSQQLGEEPAMPDPNMAPEAYCRFAWNSEPGVRDNLHTLLNPVPHGSELPAD